MKCDLCEAQATIYLTQTIGGKVQKVNLCKVCAAEKQVTDSSAYDLADLLVGVGSEKKVASPEDGSSCPECGFTHADFKRVGRLGCSSCYETFAEELKGILKAMHKGTNHVGKVPARLLDEKQFKSKIAELDNQLSDAVGGEDFETAAQLRDEIKRLEDQLAEVIAENSAPATDPSTKEDVS